MKEFVLETYQEDPALILAKQAWLSKHSEGNLFVRQSTEALIKILKPPLNSTLTATLETSRNTAHLLKTPGKTVFLLLAALGLVALSYVPTIQELPFFGPTKERQDWAIDHPIKALHCPEEIIDGLSTKHNIPKDHLIAAFNNYIEVVVDEANWVKFDAEDVDLIDKECEVELIPPKS